MELFNYENIGFLSKYSKEIYYVCLAITAIVTLILLIVAFKKYGFGKKLWGIIIAVVMGAALFFASGLLRDYTALANETYEKYQDAYKNGTVQKVSGKVENFSESDAYHKKSFTLDGVEFTVYSTKATERFTLGEAILFYVYTEDSHYYTSYGSSSGYWTYSPEKCVITGNGQNLEIHYVEEEIEIDGEKVMEKRILYIKELAE